MSNADVRTHVSRRDVDIDNPGTGASAAAAEPAGSNKPMALAAPTDAVPLSRRIAIVLTALAINGALYLLINAYPLGEPRLLPRTVLDQALDWQAWTIWPYWLLLLAGPALALAIRERRYLLPTLRAYLIAMTLNATIWLLWPTRIQRPSLPQGLDRLTQSAWELLHALDGVNNCFPSGHITIPAVTAAGFAAQYPRARPWAWLALALLTPSVITTSQHYVWDIAGGLATATLGLLLARAPLWRTGRP